MDDETLLEIDGVPTWLETPVTDVPATSPPVHSRPQVLPLSELSWEHFERLCLRYVRSRASVVMTQLYGRRGQNQYGIDLYVRLTEPARYEVYQCKRLARFEANDIAKAVDKFLNGKWREKARAFRIMTSHAIEDTRITDAIVAAQTQLNEHDIEFEVLGKEQISTWLKDHPRIVDDFFSRGWVEAFCGRDTPELKTRLNAETVAAYRVRLRTFYEVIFNRYDPGIPVRAVIGDRELPLKERFVLPEIFSSLANEPAEQKAEGVPATSVSLDVEGKGERAAPSIAIAGLRTRFDVDRWISQSQRSVILGGPGSGKSALLRTLAVELLSEEPVFRQAALRWGTMLPVWIPFSFWTSLNTKRDSPIALSECLSTWFKQFDQSEVWPLVQAAIEDERLLLLVDGLDEWTDETAARTTSNLLQTFIQLRNLPAVLVSRPHGFERVSVQGAGWQVGRLAPLSGSQQRQLVSKWLTIHRTRAAERSSHQAGGPPLENQATERETEEFTRKLARSSDLGQLAEVPLTLLLLLYLHLQNTPLPANRFDAYEHVVKHFIQEHPLARKTAAASTSDASTLTHEEIRRALAYIAYVVQTKFPAGVLTAEDIRGSLESFLRDDVEYGLGLNRQEALEALRSFTNVEEGSLGLLVSQGQSQISFFHRSLQEYLAAVHLSRTALSNQTTTIQAHLADARWREVIVGLVFLCQRGEDALALVDGIDRFETETVGSLSKEDILAEVAFKSNILPPARVKTLISRAFEIVETSPITSQRSRLLAHAMSGLHLRKNRSVIQDRLRRWIFLRGLWGGRFDGLLSWPATDHTWETLFRALHDEDGAVVREAALAAVRVFGSDRSRGDLMAGMALRSHSTSQRGACIEALATGWPEHERLNAALESGNKCNSEEVQIATTLSKVRLGKQVDEDFKRLLSLARSRLDTSIPYTWRGEIANALASGWAGDPRLKEECLNSIHHRHSHDPALMDYETAQIALIKAFPQDDDAADLIVNELKKQHAFNTSRSEVWPLLPLSFRDHPKVVAAFDQWALAESYRDVIALHFGSMVGRTPTMKKRLLQAIDELHPFWAIESLLNGWGMSDVEVAEKLRARARRADAAEFAQHLPAILGDPNAARERLLALLRDPKSHRIDFLMQGFSKLTDRGDVAEIVQAALDRFSDPGVKINYAGSLILAFPNDPRVRALARENLHSRSPSLRAIVELAAFDEELRVEVAERLTPLPVDLRYQIVSDLPVFADQTFAFELLRDWDTERNVEVKTQASVQYHTHVEQSGRDIVEATNNLQTLLPCYGIDHEDRRQAAAAGLIVLKRLTVIVGKTERHTGEQVSIGLYHGFRENRVLLDLLGKNWLYVKGIIGEQWNIFTDRTAPNDLWDRLATVATEHPELARDILEKADSDWTLMRSANVLTLLSRTNPKSERLASACISALASNENWQSWHDSVDAASDILADQFREDSEVEKRIVAIASENRIPVGVIMALSLGWRKSELLKQLDFGPHPRALTAGELYLKYAVTAAPEIPAIIEADFAWARHNRFHVKMMIKPLLARLRFDPEVAAHIFAHLKTSTNSNVKASFPKLLAATGEMTPERADWCREELERQQSLVSPEIGYDALARAPRSVSLCLLESLGETPPAGTQVSPEI